MLLTCRSRGQKRGARIRTMLPAGSLQQLNPAYTQDINPIAIGYRIDNNSSVRHKLPFTASPLELKRLMRSVSNV